MAKRMQIKVISMTGDTVLTVTLPEQITTEEEAAQWFVSRYLYVQEVERAT